MSQGASLAAFRLVTLQTVITLVAASAAAFLGTREALSALAGGGVCVVCNFLVAARLFAGRNQRDAARFVRQFYVAEAQKFVVTGMLFVLVFVKLDIEPWVVFVTYLVTSLGNWLMLIDPATQDGPSQQELNKKTL